MTARVYQFIPPRLEAKEDKSSDSAELYVYGPIGGGFLTDGATAADVRHALQGISAKTINVHIQSYGGDAFEGVAIGNLLKNNSAKIHVYIDGVAASAASVIAMAGDTITMPKNTMLMIHRASLLTFGNKAAHQQSIDMLDKVDKALEESYKPRFTGTDLELENMLDKGTWLTADDAKYYGFADEVVEESKKADDAGEDNDGDDKNDSPDEEDSDPGGGDPAAASTQSAGGFDLDMLSRAIASATNKIIKG